MAIQLKDATNHDVYFFHQWSSKTSIYLAQSLLDGSSTTWVTLDNNVLSAEEGEEENETGIVVRSR
jgi:hypothetical protein